MAIVGISALPRLGGRSYPPLRQILVLGMSPGGGQGKGPPPAARTDDGPLRGVSAARGGSVRVAVPVRPLREGD